MNIQIKKWNEVNLRLLAELAFSSIHNSGLKLNDAKSIESVENWLNELEFSAGSFGVLSYSGVDIVGWLMVVKQDNGKFAMNPWGMHPFVSPDCDVKIVTASLVKHAIETAVQRGVSQIQFYVQRSREMSDEIHETYKELYDVQGLLLGGKSVDMKLDLKDVSLESNEIPRGYQLVPTEKFELDTLYSCYYDAFDAEKLDFFIQQSQEERRVYFNELISMELNTDTSLAIERDGELVGFSLVIPYGEENLHLTCICIHPDFAGEGLGRFLLKMVEREAKNQEIKTMTLYTDQDIRAYNLYIKNGWQVTETYTEYRWQH